MADRHTVYISNGFEGDRRRVHAFLWKWQCAAAMLAAAGDVCLVDFMCFLIKFTAQSDIMQVINRPTRKTLTDINGAFEKCQKITNIFFPKSKIKIMK